MPSVNIIKKVNIERTPRVLQLEGFFDITPETESVEKWDVNFKLPKKWSIGVIIGPSGTGKTIVLKELFGKYLVKDFNWSHKKSVLDGFDENVSIKTIIKVLSSVGFSSPPEWLRPFHVLSQGEQFRVNMARLLLNNENNICAVDEFTSVLDRTVAQIGSAAIQKTVRKMKKQLIVASCHYDIIDWLCPDWIYEPHINNFKTVHLWRPEINIKIQRVHRDAWQLFKKYHYLNTSLNKSAKCFVAFVFGKPAAFTAVVSFPHPIAPSWRGHRSVCLPDFQGVGIGTVLQDYVAGLFASQKRYFDVTSHPALIHQKTASKNWRMRRKPKLQKSQKTGITAYNKTVSRNRLTCSFDYCGKCYPKDASRFNLFPSKVYIEKS